MQVFLLPGDSSEHVGCNQFVIDLRQMLNVDFNSV